MAYEKIIVPALDVRIGDLVQAPMPNPNGHPQRPYWTPTWIEMTSHSHIIGLLAHVSHPGSEWIEIYRDEAAA